MAGFGGCCCGWPGQADDQVGDRVDDRWVELGAGAVAQLGYGLGHGQLSCVGAEEGHGREGAADGDDPGPQGDLLAGQPARVAAAVEAFVGGVHQPVEQRYSDAA